MERGISKKIVLSYLDYSISNSHRHSPKETITGKPRGVSTAYGRAQTLNDAPHRPISSTFSTSQDPHLSITVKVPSN